MKFPALTSALNLRRGALVPLDKLEALRSVPR